MSATVPHHIIAIGASAGSMEEINSFFDHTPLDGVCYVIIQHLSPDFKSRMVELLARHSKLVVKEAAHGEQVSCNEVYLIPNDRFMTIQNGRLHLTDKAAEKAPHLTINFFFKSLAIDCGSKAIGVILSGLGMDGTEGIKAIKKAGGMVIARNPERTAFGSMPSNAIATGLVDFILEPALMPHTIEDYIKYGGDYFLDNKEDEKNIIAIVDFIKEKSPLDFTDYKHTTILRRTKRRAAGNNITSLERYLDFLKETPEEVSALAKDFLISVTAFFRDPEAFELIRQKVIPDILQKLTPGEELKIWVAGCATGEEVYSMAILIAEQLTGKLSDTVVKIFATDIDSTALVHAGKGLYNTAVIKHISPERLEKFFIRTGDGYKVKPEIRKMVIFAQHDLVKNPPYCNMHFIGCRNLLIYMTPVLQKKVFSMLLFGLKKDGYLFLGSSENPMPIIKNLQEIDKTWKIYKNLDIKRDVRFDNFSIPQPGDIKRTPSISIRNIMPQSMGNALEEAMNDTLVNEMDCLVICIDENKQVFKSYGNTAKYLLQKNFSLDLLELLPKPMAIAFNALCVRALRINGKAAVGGIEIINDDVAMNVRMSVTPLVQEKGAGDFLMITICEDHAVALKEKVSISEETFLAQYTLDLERELKELKGKLHAAYEQLDASYENMQSFNEELLSANEEMQSTNEEMQSVNEELDTINSNYQIRNKELLEINDDLNNYFRSNINGQLFINNDLLLMKFSPGTLKQINLLETDIGRPISNISTNIKFETLVTDIQEVLSQGGVITKEIETNDGKWYQVMTMPYVRQADNKNNGAIVTFNDITELKSTQLKLDARNESLLRINADLDNFVHAASHDLLAPLSNIEESIGVMNLIRIVDPELKDFLDIIDISVKKFRTLIIDIATIAKMESDMITMEMVDMHEIINNIEWSLDNKIRDAHATINRYLDIDKILFSKKNLRSILYNLISNGIKFKGGQRPVLNIYTRKEQDNIVLTVEDNGIGIDEQYLDKIFDMYGRIHTDIDGNGIGLYLARKIVDAANGKITVASEPGKGTKFHIYFKIAEELA
ncbi:chemotaxis protein CheR [Chitinophaga sp. SYP-B3965]|uniref:chemotaxis protein CheB n=1 Tax=Chitinophaga sp. SYP-B3965 TaxID=2663120 RepID=UPI001299BB76|nr:chemotaxis protein CheB [Chitinophaga sp. SYP-B3965]MRG43900.1 chemotaxis protein CheR [Chitinophaga sp. SYP-B3965]